MAEKEYIERDEAVEWARLTYCKECNSFNGVKCRACPFDDAIGLIEDYPAADVVEVLRCKDCKHFIAEMIGDSLECICKFSVGMVHISPASYCSYGERKEQK